MHVRLKFRPVRSSCVWPVSNVFYESNYIWHFNYFIPADAWTSDNRPLSVVVADIGIEIPKIISNSKSRKAYNRDRKREYRKRKSVQAPSTSTSSSIVRYWNPPMNEEEAELEKIMIDMKIFVCNYCDENCETFSGLKRHVRKEHANQFGNYEVCCNKTLKTQDAQSLYDHIRLHLNKESFKCPDCGKCVESKAILNSHILKLHTESSAKFVCDTCGIGFSSYSLLSHHLRRKHKPKFKCSYCQLGEHRIVLRINFLFMSLTTFYISQN